MMKKRTTGIVFCIICTLLCAGLYLPASADIGTESYEQTMMVLQRVGILEAGVTGNAGDAVSRAEFTALAVRAMGIDTTLVNTVGSGFTDVPDAHPYAGVVKQARELGLIEGNGNTMFYPDSKISYQEAAKILVTVTGYHRKISGNSMTSYMAMANQIGIMRGTGTLNYSMAARRDVLYKMLENTLDVEVLKQTGFGTEQTYESKSGETVMSEYLKIGKYKGIVTATPSTSYNGTSNLKDGQIEIDSVTYSVSYNRSQVDSLLGWQVTYYVDISDPTEEYPTIVLLLENMSDDRVLNVSAEDIKPDTTAKMLYYYTYSDSGATHSQTAQIEQTANVIYNGVYWGKAHMLEASDLQPLTGSVTLVDTDSNGSYDLVIIEDILTIVVESVNTEERIISDYYKRINLTLDTSEELYITRNGMSIELSDLKAWDVLAVKEDKDKTIAEIEVTSSKISGTVTAVGDDTLTVESQEVELAESLKQFLDTTTEAKYQVSLNDAGSFYLDRDGKIAAVDVGAKSGSTGTYAYLIKYAMGDGLSTSCEMKVLTGSNEILTLTSAAKVTIDGVTGQNGTALYERFEELAYERPAGSYSGSDATIDAAYTRQNYVIVYKTNEAGEVTEVDTVIDNEAENGRGISLDYPTLYKRYKSGYKFSSTTNSSTYNFVYSGSTIMFNIPLDENADDKSYTAINDFTHDTFFYVSAYDRVDGVVSVVCNFIESSGGDGDAISTNVDTLNTIGVVQKVTQTTTDDNETVSKIYLMNVGREVSYTVVPDKTIPDLKFGDVIVYHSDSLGRIDALRVVFQPEEDTAPFLSGAASSYETLYGTVYEKFSNVVTMVTDNSKLENPTLNDLEPYMINNFLRIYLVDMVEEEVRLATTADICAYETDPDNASMMFMKLYYDIPKEAVIYKWK